MVALYNASFIHSFIPNLYDFFPLCKIADDVFKNAGNKPIYSSIDIHLFLVTNILQNTLILCSTEKKKAIKVWNDMRISKLCFISHICRF